MTVHLVSKTQDTNEDEPWTIFTFHVFGGGPTPARLRRQIQRILPDDVCPDSNVRGQQVSVTIVTSKIDRATQLLKGKHPEIAALMNTR